MTGERVDVKEGVYYGRDVSPDESQEGNPMVGANQFPSERDLPGFADTVKDYMSQMVKVG